MIRAIGREMRIGQFGHAADMNPPWHAMSFMEVRSANGVLL